MRATARPLDHRARHYLAGWSRTAEAGRTATSRRSGRRSARILAYAFSRWLRSSGSVGGTERAVRDSNYSRTAATRCYSIQTSKRRDRLLHHGFHFRIIGNVAADAQGFVSLVSKLFGFRLDFLSFQSANTTDAPDSAKALAVARPNPDAAPVTSATCPSNEIIML